MLRRTLILILIVLAVSAGWAAAQNNENRRPLPAEAVVRPIIFKGKVFCSLTRDVEMYHYGVIRNVLVKAGQAVQQNAVLARFDLTLPDQSKMRGMLSRLPLSRIELQLAKAVQGLREAEIKLAESKRMVKQKLAPKATLNQAQAERDLGLRQVQVLRLEREEALGRLNTNRREVAHWTGQPKPVVEMPKDAALVAPIAGHVIWVNPNLRPRALIPPKHMNGQSAFLVGVMNPMVVRAKVHEAEAMRLKVGDKAQVQVDSIAGRVFPAVVSRLAWSPDTLDPVEASYYQVELVLPNDDLILKNGLKCRVTINK